MATKKEKVPCAECAKLEKMLRDEEIQHLCDRNKAEVEREELLGVIQALLKTASDKKAVEEKHRQRSVRYLIAVVPMLCVITAMCMLQNSGIVSEAMSEIIGCVMLMGVSFCAAVIWERIKK